MPHAHTLHCMLTSVCITTQRRQQISLKQGAVVPLASSAALFGAYLLIKFVPNLSLQTFFKCAPGISF